MFVISTQKNKNNKIIHVEILKKKKRHAVPMEAPSNSTFYKALETSYGESEPRRSHLTMQAASLRAAIIPAANAEFNPLEVSAL